MNISILPESIQIKIFEYNPEHRILFSYSLKKIPMSFARSKINKIINEYSTFDNHLPLDHVVSANIDDHELFVEILSKCKCCLRHQQRRPTSLHNLNGTPPFGVFYNVCQVPSACKCYCRTISRSLCRAHGLVPFDETFGNEFEGEEEWFSMPTL